MGFFSALCSSHGYTDCCLISLEFLSIGTVLRMIIDTWYMKEGKEKKGSKEEEFNFGGRIENTKTSLLPERNQSHILFKLPLK